ncbi:MAG TPA: hypothetical protein VKE27_11405 [Candidatus Dormibacteraeota bacterium]|nr:hypothetical protein [Candidatus Dormibacteraeota bacterium]
MATTDKDVLDRFHAIVGVGTVRGPYDRSTYPGVTKQVWQWSTHGFEKVQYLAALLWSGLGTRRKARVTELLTAAEGMPTSGPAWARSMRRA